MEIFKTISVIILAVIVLTALYFMFFTNKPIPFLEKKAEFTKDELVQKAQELFKQKKSEGVNMTNEPCLTNELAPDWVVDVVHSPRQEIDNKTENQCLAFREGKAKHFIELDLQGNVLKFNK